MIVWWNLISLSRLASAIEFDACLREKLTLSTSLDTFSFLEDNVS